MANFFPNVFLADFFLFDFFASATVHKPMILVVRTKLKKIIPSLISPSIGAPAQNHTPVSFGTVLLRMFSIIMASLQMTSSLTSLSFGKGSQSLHDLSYDSSYMPSYPFALAGSGAHRSRFRWQYVQSASAPPETRLIRLSVRFWFLSTGTSESLKLRQRQSSSPIGPLGGPSPRIMNVSLANFHVLSALLRIWGSISLQIGLMNDLSGFSHYKAS